MRVAMLRYLVSVLAVVTLTGCAAHVAASFAQIDDMPNPGRGWTTQHSTTNDPRNDHYPTSTIAYYRLAWSEVEPTEGAIDFDAFDALFAVAASDEQQLAFRIQPEVPGETGYETPEWLRDQIDGIFYSDREGEHFMPDFDDEVYLSNAERLLAELGARYADDPRLAFVDIGLVGHWGEWHVSAAEEFGAQMPTLDNQKRIIDAHIEAFPDVPVVMMVGSLDAENSEDSAAALRYAIERGAGWRADCWGDYGRGWNHMQDGYPARLEAAGAEDAWRNAPVVLETCGVPSDWFWLYPSRIGEILEFAIERHASIINAKSDKLPRLWRDRFAEFTSQLGYRFLLESAALPTREEGTLVVQTSWRNVGNAPIYRPQTLTMRLLGAGSYQFAGETDLRTWLPGDSIPVSIHADLAGVASGEYEVEIGIVNPATDRAEVRFIAGEPPAATAWYKAGVLVVE